MRLATPPSHIYWGWLLRSNMSTDFIQHHVSSWSIMAVDWLSGLIMLVTMLFTMLALVRRHVAPRPDPEPDR